MIYYESAPEEERKSEGCLQSLRGGEADAVPTKEGFSLLSERGCRERQMYLLQLEKDDDGWRQNAQTLNHHHLIGN